MIRPIPPFTVAILGLISILTVACATGEKSRGSGPQGSILERIPIVYRQDIQQGNVMDQNMVNQLHPGLSKRQVKFVLGSPMLIDPFQKNRWDYVYNMTHGWGETEHKLVRVYFTAEDLLERVEGDLKPVPGSAPLAKQDVMVSVPDYQDPNRGVIKQAVEEVDSILKDKASNKTKPSSEKKPYPTEHGNL